MNFSEKNSNINISRIIKEIFFLDSLTGKGLVCYFTNWAQYRPGLGKYVPENIDPFLCDVLIYAFAELEDDKRLKPFEWNDLSEPWMKGMYEKTIDLKRVNSKLKVLLAVGGWNHGPGNNLLLLKIKNEFFFCIKMRSLSDFENFHFILKPKPN